MWNLYPGYKRLSPTRSELRFFMQIQWTLDTEDPIDPNNLLADIQLSEAGEFIGRDAAFIDSWLEALGAAYLKLSRAAAVEVRVLEESYPLFVKRTPDGVVLSFSNQHLTIPSVENLGLAVVEACKRLSAELRKHQVFQGEKVCGKLRRISEQILGQSAVGLEGTGTGNAIPPR